ncbi:MAG: bifunctional nicotinamide-nucleotide adenylyltransferase/Nudix hydroxylase [Oceanococcus sp.]
MEQTPLALVIGRFQPFHRGHELICRQALQDCQRLLIILGSGQQARSVKNPWTDAEREALIRASLPDIASERLLFESVPDVFYNEDVWLGAVRQAVETHQEASGTRLYGHTKDSSSYYLSLFPQWQYQELPNYQNLSATPLREALLAAGPNGSDEVLHDWRDRLPQCGVEPLRDLLGQAEFTGLCVEFEHIKHWRKSWSASPYPPVFVTADALLECNGHVLLIQRGRAPGEGLWALPGGFLDQDERLQAAAQRELQEETGLDVTALAASEPRALVYDAPERSDRGRVITHVFHYQLQGSSLPQVQGGDDAALAQWWAFADIRRDMLFDDHYCILQHALNWY